MPERNATIRGDIFLSKILAFLAFLSMASSFIIVNLLISLVHVIPNYQCVPIFFNLIDIKKNMQRGFLALFEIILSAFSRFKKNIRGHNTAPFEKISFT